MNRKRLVTLPVLLLILLSAIGISYAAWFDTITILGTAETGELEFLFDWRESPDPTERYIDPETGIAVEGEWLGKEVGELLAYYANPEFLCPTCACPPDQYASPQGLYGWEYLVIEANNVYPGYIASTEFKYWNPGSIPLVVVGLDFKGTKDCEPLYDLLWDATVLNGDIYEDKNGNGEIDAADGLAIANIKIDGLALDYQIDPCDFIEKAEIDIHFYQPIEECCTYTFWFRLKAIQWNKVYEAPEIDWGDWPELIVID